MIGLLFNKLGSISNIYHVSIALPIKSVLKVLIFNEIKKIKKVLTR